ncbi:MAG: DUF1858 domain-containing protein [Anaerolineaceae bacterium]|nr:MAG: DUF1858 domain-containing protein [Anaerolineaceae bacterium]
MEYKIIDLNRSVYDLCNEYKDLPDILHDLGFVDIVKPGMLHTAGRFMTIKKGADLKKISLDTVKERLLQYGYKTLD